MDQEERHAVHASWSCEADLERTRRAAIEQASVEELVCELEKKWRRQDVRRLQSRLVALASSSEGTEGVGRDEQACTTGGRRTEREAIVILGLGCDVLCRVWPANRVIAGQKTCRQLRSELAKARHVLLKAKKKCEILDLARANMQQYNERLDVELSSKSQHKVIFAILHRLSRQGWCPELRLVMSFNNMSLKGAMKLAETVPFLKNLWSVDVSENGIGGVGCSKIVWAMTDLEHVATLNLQGNDLQADGARRIAGALPKIASLRAIDLRSNSIGPEGIEKLSLCLARCPSLTRLHLGDNVLLAEGAKHVASMLPKCSQLMSLNLCKNVLMDRGVNLIASVLPATSCLTQLDLCGNEISDAGFRILASVLPECSRSLRLDLKGNKISRSKLLSACDEYEVAFDSVMI